MPFHDGPSSLTLDFFHFLCNIRTHSPSFSKNTQLPSQSCRQNEQKRKTKVLHGSGVEVRYLQTSKPMLGGIGLYSSGDAATALVFTGKKTLSEVHHTNDLATLVLRGRRKIKVGEPVCNQHAVPPTDPDESTKAASCRTNLASLKCVQV